MKHQTLKPTKTSDQKIFVFECTYFDGLGHQHSSQKFTKEVKVGKIKNVNHRVFCKSEDHGLVVNTGQL